VRSIGRAGWASHGFFGATAQTFGNPDGASSGGGAWTGVTNQGGDGAAAGLGREIRDGGANPNGPGQGGGGTHPAPPVPTFTQVDNGTFAGKNVIDVAIGSALNIVVACADGSAGYSSDGGHTWNTTAAPGTVVAAQSLICNSNGSVYLMPVVKTGAVPDIATSSNQGATFELSGPPANVSTQVFYSQIHNLFFFFDAVDPLIWTSADGATWTQHALSQNFPLTETATQNGSGFCMAENNVQTVCQTNDSNTNFLIWVTSDLITWTQAFFQAGGVAEPLTMRWTGAKFISAALQQDEATVQFLESNATGTAWSVSSDNGGNDAVAPYVFNEVFYKGLIYSAFQVAAGVTIASSPDGVTWTDIPLSATFDGVMEGLTADPNFMFVWGGAIFATNNGTVFSEPVPEFSSAGPGIFNSLKVGSGLLFAVGRDDSFNGVIWRAVD
jgi:hypothetical protein